MLGSGIEIIKKAGHIFEGKKTRDERLASKFSDQYRSIEAKLKKLGCSLFVDHASILNSGGWRGDRFHTEVEYILVIPQKSKGAVQDLIDQAGIKLPVQNQSGRVKGGTFAPEQTPGFIRLVLFIQKSPVEGR